MKYSTHTISRGVINHLNRDPRYKPLNPKDVEDLVKAMIRINPPIGMYDSEFVNRVASVVVREPKNYTTEGLIKNLHPVIERNSHKKMFSLVKLYPFIITEGTMNAFCKRGHKELRQFRKTRIHVSRGPYPWIHYSIDDLEDILNVLVDKKVISINPIHNNDYDIV